MKLFTLVTATALLSNVAFAQFGTNLPPLAGAPNPDQGGIFPLPDGVERLVAIDAQNSILAQMRPEDGQDRHYRLIKVKHVYVGGITRLFSGSTIIPTAPFVSPGFAQGMQGSQFGGAQGGNFGFAGNNGSGAGGNNGFLFPQSGGIMNQTNRRLTPNARRAQPTRSQPGLNIGTPLGSFALPAQIEID